MLAAVVSGCRRVVTRRARGVCDITGHVGPSHRARPPSPRDPEGRSPGRASRSGVDERVPLSCARFGRVVGHRIDGPSQRVAQAAMSSSGAVVVHIEHRGCSRQRSWGASMGRRHPAVTSIPFALPTGSLRQSRQWTVRDVHPAFVPGSITSRRHGLLAMLASRASPATESRLVHRRSARRGRGPGSLLSPHRRPGRIHRAAHHPWFVHALASSYNTRPCSRPASGRLFGLGREAAGTAPRLYADHPPPAQIEDPLRLFAVGPARFAIAAPR